MAKLSKLKTGTAAGGVGCGFLLLAALSLTATAAFWTGVAWLIWHVALGH